MIVGPGLLRGGGSARRTRLGPAPTGEADPARGIWPAGVAFTRASAANRIDYRGYLVSSAVDAIRTTYDPALTYNYFADAWFDAVTVGAAAPSWVSWSGGGVTWTNTVTAKGVTGDGLPFVTVRGTGLTNNTGTIQITAGAGGAGNGVPVLVGETFAGWARISLLRYDGIPTAPAAASLRLQEAQDVFVAAGFSVMAASPAPGTLTWEGSAGRTATNANTRQGAVSLSLGGPASAGITVDVEATVVFPIVHPGLVPITNSVSPQILAARNGTIPQYGLLGFLFEEAGTNLMETSDDFAAAAFWTLNSATITAAAKASAWGALTRFDEGVANAAHGSTTVDFFSTTLGVSYTLSQVFRAETCSAVVLAFGSAMFGATAFAAFDLSAGTVGQVGAGVTPWIVSLGNGLYRCGISAAATATGIGTGAAQWRMAQSAAAPGRDPAYVGTSRTVLTGRVMVQSGVAWLTSFIATTAGPVARSRDVPDVSSALLGTGPASLAMRFAYLTPPGDSMLLAVSPGDNGPRIYSHASGSTRVAIRRAAADEMLTTFAQAVGAMGSMCMAWGGGAADVAANGAAPVNDPAVLDPQSYAGTPISLNGITGLPGPGMILRYLRLWAGTRLTAAQVQAQSARLS